MFKVPQPAKFVPEYDRFIYEPRVMWSIASVDSDEETRVTLPQQHFKNASRYPVRLTHVLLSPINYLLQEYSNASPTSTANFDVCGSIITKCSLRISAPFSYQFQNVLDLPFLGLAASPSATPSMQGIKSNIEYQSNLLGLSRWDFECPLYMPAKGLVQFDLSTVSYATAVPDLTPPTTSMIIMEGGGSGPGMFAGHARLRERAQTSWAQTDPTNPQVYWPRGQQPLPLDATAAGFNGEVDVWPANQIFKDREFRKQNAVRGYERVPVTGFAIHIDQIAFDDEVQDSVPYAGFLVSQMSQRMICRARTTSGGTGEWWWRPGAPISLVCPTISSALVHELNDPIWLAPDESLEIEIKTPGPTVISGGQQPLQISPIYNVGVSLAGQAVVEMR